MPTETEFSNVAPAADSTGSATTKTADPGGRSGSMSSAKYRVSSRPANLLIPTSIDTPEAVSCSPESQLSTTNVSTLLKRMSKNSASRIPLSSPSGADGSTTGTTGKPKNARYAINTETASSLKGSGATVGTPKLPQKLRQHVNRLRTQFASGSALGAGSTRNLSLGGRNSSSATSSLRPSLSSASTNSKRFSIAAAAAIQYSRRSNQLQQLQVTKEDEKPIESAPKRPASPQELESTVVSASTFQDLLRPLQTSLSCASLSAGWPSDEEDEAEQVFRQSERDNSRMLRVCCSIDNLMLSIGVQAQEQKPIEAVVRDSTRDLVKLFQFAMTQVISVIFNKSPDQVSNNDSYRDNDTRVAAVKVGGQEAQYAMEFLLEINERIGKLYEFARSVFVVEVDGLRQRIKELEEELAAAALNNEQLQTEMRDLRDFHEQNNVSSVDSYTSSSSGSRLQVLDNCSEDPAISALAFSEVSSEAGGDENSALKQQCQELSRLLEMAKQEIRLSHHERDVQKARVAELSSALFHDSELGMLRNQLQSEKRRVRVLERENLTLRESQQEQVMKLHSLELQVTSTPSIGRHSNKMSQPSVDAAPTNMNSTVAVERQSVVLRNESREESTMSTSKLTFETQENQNNFTYSGVRPGLLQDNALGCVMNWFSRIVTPPQVVNIRKPRKKQTESKPEQQPPIELTKFISGLLMNDKQLAIAKEESKVRRQGSVPSLMPPVRAPSTRSVEGSGSRKATGKNKRPRSAAATGAPDNNISRTNSAEAEENSEEIVAGCLQLVWAFYQRFLVAVEAQNLLGNRGIGGDPTLGAGVSVSAGNPATEPVALSLIVFHFFLERCSRELDAAHELEQFVRCLHGVRSASYNLELFCQFLEETCSRQELCFFLWVCQAIDDVRLGVPYDQPLPSNYDGTDKHHDSATQFICVLKATFLSRTIFRLLHFKVLCRPSTGSGHRGKAKRSPIKRSNSSAPASMVVPISPSTSPKRKPRTRLGELSAVLSPTATATAPAADVADTGQEEQKKIPLHIAAQTALREIIESNQGEPISLETFNRLLLKFAVAPSTHELAARLGPFYQPTGDERKIPTDVFLALLVETYKFQLQWQRDQLRALFVHLNRQEEVQQRATEKLGKAEVVSGRRQAGEEDSKRSKAKFKRRKRRDGATEALGASKYLRGLSRSVLRELLLQSGIVQDTDLAQMDMDWLFAELLKAAGGVAADITFDGLFDALQKMKWLESTKLRVDALMEVAGAVGVLPFTRLQSGKSFRGVNSLIKTRTSSVGIPSPMVLAIREKWRVYGRHSLALCNNDPNVFIRRHAQRLLHYVDQELARLVNESESIDAVSGDAVQCVREFLSFAWRVAAKRSSRNGMAALRQTCLTEVFLVSQALRSCIDSMSGYHGHFAPMEDKATESKPAEENLRLRHRQSSNGGMKGTLHSFYDTSRMNLNQFIKEKTTSGVITSASGQVRELENVLTLYAAHIEHLFQRFSEACYNCSSQVPFHRWRSMVYELDLVHPRNLPFVRLQTLFASVVKVSESDSRRAATIEVSLDQELGVRKTQFSELFVLIAIERHRVVAARKLEKAQLATIKRPRGSQDNNEALLEAAELTDRPGRIMAQFCREILAPRAFAGDNALVERNFAAKLSCPLVGRALLEHRSFLRTVFFFYAKQDEVAADERAALEEQALIHELQETGGRLDGNAQGKDPKSCAADALLQPDLGSDFHLEKTKRSSMSFGEFQTFLAAFGLLDSPDDSIDESYSALWNGNKVTLADAQHVFSAVMSLDNDDTLQLEFDEFAAASVALAVHLDPSPFSMWHQKLDGFATKLRRVWETCKIKR